MSAQLHAEGAAALHAGTMTLADLPAVLAIEQAVYAFPWTRGNFVDSLVAGNDAQLLRDSAGSVCAYSLAMAGVQEMHLLNLSVAPAWQHRGVGRRLLDALVQRSRAAGAASLWLEVRMGNQRARAIYREYGFVETGQRRVGYYPAGAGQREDACVMCLALSDLQDRDALE